MNVVLTRPAPRNKELLQLLSADGLQVLDLPALVLQEQTNALQTDFNINNYDAIFFVSRLAAELFLKKWLELNQKWPSELLACAVGFSSANPLINSGLIPNELIIYPSPDELNQDSEALWDLIKNRIGTLDQNTDRVKSIKNTLIVRGQAGREWLSNKLTNHAIHVDKIAIYNRQKATWDNNQIQQLTKMLNDKHQDTVFLLTSSESLSAIYNNVLDNGLLDKWSKCIFVCVHHRIATALQAILDSCHGKTKFKILITTPTNIDIYNTIRSIAH